jgi:glycopeptide antibiotics resistance protein
LENTLAILSAHNKTIGLLIVLAAIFLLVLFGELPDNSLFWQEMQNSGHTLLFAIVAVLILQLLRDTTYFSRQTPAKLYVVAGIASLLTGLLIEIMQLMLHSDASKMDVLRDLAGIIAGLGLYAVIDPYLQPNSLKLGKRIGIVILSLCVFVTSLFSLARISVAYAQRGEAFPLVVDLTANWSEVFIRTKHATVKIGGDQKLETTDKLRNLVHVHFERARYPGLSMIELYPDWSLFNTLTLDIYSQLPRTFSLVLRIHDQQHDMAYSDRFNRRLTVMAGENHFRIPLHDIKDAPADREMDMTRVNGLMLFAAKSDTPLNFYLGAIGLE